MIQKTEGAEIILFFWWSFGIILEIFEIPIFFAET